MKKCIICGLLVLAAVFGTTLCACSHDPAPTDPPQTTETTAPTTVQTDPVEVTYGADDIRTNMPQFGGYGYSAEVTKEGTNKTEALALTREILTHPCELYILGDGYGNPMQVLLDVNNDGTPERVALSCSGEKGYTYSFTEEEGLPYVCWENLTLAVGNAQKELSMERDEKHLWRIIAMSLDGEKILVGIQAGDNTALYSYDGEKLSGIISGGNLFAEDTVISADRLVMRTTVRPFGNEVVLTWKMGEYGFAPVYENAAYDCVDDFTFRLNKDICLYTEPDLESEQILLQAQTFRVLQVDLSPYNEPNDPKLEASSTTTWGGKYYWTYLRAEDGTEGWAYIGAYTQTADGTEEFSLALFEQLS